MYAVLYVPICHYLLTCQSKPWAPFEAPFSGYGSSTCLVDGLKHQGLPLQSVSQPLLQLGNSQISFTELQLDIICNAIFRYEMLTCQRLFGACKKSLALCCAISNTLLWHMRCRLPGLGTLQMLFGLLLCLRGALLHRGQLCLQLRARFFCLCQSLLGGFQISMSLRQLLCSLRNLCGKALHLILRVL